VGVYVTIHSLFLFVHVATLSVAVNSADNALLTILISGNFAEIKSTVFKKYNKSHLFKITTSDICERFKLALFLLLILFLNRFQGEMTASMVNDYYSMCGIVLVAELISDWIKVRDDNFLLLKIKRSALKFILSPQCSFPFEFLVRCIKSIHLLPSSI
jgi:hypothetical protein